MKKKNPSKIAGPNRFAPSSESIRFGKIGRSALTESIRTQGESIRPETEAQVFGPESIRNRAESIRKQGILRNFLYGDFKPFLVGFIELGPSLMM